MVKIFQLGVNSKRFLNNGTSNIVIEIEENEVVEISEEAFEIDEEIFEVQLSNIIVQLTIDSFMMFVNNCLEMELKQ